MIQAGLVSPGFLGPALDVLQFSSPKSDGRDGPIESGNYANIFRSVNIVEKGETSFDFGAELDLGNTCVLVFGLVV